MNCVGETSLSTPSLPGQPVRNCSSLAKARSRSRNWRNSRLWIGSANRRISQMWFLSWLERTEAGLTRRFSGQTAVSPGESPTEHKKNKNATGHSYYGRVQRIGSSSRKILVPRGTHRLREHAGHHRPQRATGESGRGVRRSESSRHPRHRVGRCLTAVGGSGGRENRRRERASGCSDSQNAGLAEALHAKGNKVIISGRRRSVLEEVTKANRGMVSVEFDIESPAGIASVAESLRSIIRDLMY
jgi:hypothetical protein